MIPVRPSFALRVAFPIRVSRERTYSTMKTIAWLCLVFPLTLLALSGCSGSTTEKPKGRDGASAPAKTGGHANDEASIRANLEKLNPEDRKLAEEQQFCAVESKNLLGSMGVPYKVTIKDQPVFLCCDGCETRAKAHADRTLARVQQLKEKKAGTPPK